MAIIDEKAAWDILQKYIEDCRKIDSSSLIAIFATGSLPGGYYRPGQSDIDAVLIIKNGSEDIWGNSERPSKPLENLNRRYLETYQIPKDFGPFPLQARELFPPYDPENDFLTQEITRLKFQGKLVYGNFELEEVPLPSIENILADAKHFEEWWRDQFSIATKVEAMSPEACVNTILIHLRRFLQIKRGVIEFNKLKVVSAYLDNEPPFINNKALQLVMDSLAIKTISDIDQEFLKEYVFEFRTKMNAHLGIVV
jgi:hypothetical protein